MGCVPVSEEKKLTNIFLEVIKITVLVKLNKFMQR
jgi:hypothetical protein